VSDTTERGKRTKIPAEYREGEPNSLDRHWRSKFLDHLAETSNVTKAAEFANINPSRAYKVRRCEPEFAKAWHDALLEGYQHLEMETLRRLRKGTRSDEPKFDIANALRLLSLHRDSVAKAQAARRNVSAQEVRASIDRKVEQIRLQAMAENTARAVD